MSVNLLLPAEEAVLTKGNSDYIHGKLVSRSTYALTGRQISGSEEAGEDGKSPTEGPPISITTASPGVTQIDDDMWTLTYGASYDAFLTLINGRNLQTTIDNIQLEGIYKDGSVTLEDNNLWDKANGQNQITYLAAGESASEGANNAFAGFPDIESSRGLGIRVPTMVGGWGRTIDGLPTDPLPTDIRKNDEKHKLDRSQWKFGSVEYRWDYRKSVWAAYNELIADHEEKDLGTWVFSTNPDTDEGYPFLRGKLEDVWWVRQSVDLDGEDGKTEGTRTGEIFTHLNHRWFDVEEEGIGRLSSIFIIPHKDKTDDKCHEQGDENVLGEETTGDSFEERIDIRTKAHFFKDKGVDGPIFFDRKVSEMGGSIACKPARQYFFTGRMVFEDEPVETCESTSFQGPFGPAAVIGEAPPPRWLPAIAIDECELVGKHFQDLIINDINLGVNLSNICNGIAHWSEDFADDIGDELSTVANAVTANGQAIDALVLAAAAAITSVGNSLASEIESLDKAIGDAFIDLIRAINIALAACGCESEVGSIDPSYGGHPGGFAVKFDIRGDGAKVNAPEKFTCESCVGTEIWMPCATKDKVIAGTPCGPPDDFIVDTKFGNYQAHPSKTGGAAVFGQGPFGPEDTGGIEGEGL